MTTSTTSMISTFRTGPVGGLLDRAIGDRFRRALDRRVDRAVRTVGRDLEQRLATRDRRTERTLTDRIRAEVAAALDDPRTSARELSLDVLLGQGTAADRLLDPRRWQDLARQLSELTGCRRPEWPMQQAYRSLIAQEMSGLGRIAGSTYNIVGKLVAPTLLAPPEGPVLEIGTLYGLFSPALVRQFRRVGDFRSLTVVDPLAGSQIQPGTRGGADPSGTPVVRAVAERNFLESGLAADEITVIEGYSTDPEVRAAAASARYAVVIIDGDHSEDGVYEDLWWVQSVTRPGAVVVMDDFGDPRWPGVEAATVRYLADGGALELLGRASTSAYLRLPAGGPAA